MISLKSIMKFMKGLHALLIIITADHHGLLQQTEWIIRIFIFPKALFTWREGNPLRRVTVLEAPVYMYVGLSPGLSMFAVVCSWREYDSNLITLQLTLLGACPRSSPETRASDARLVHLLVGSHPLAKTPALGPAIKFFSMDPTSFKNLKSLRNPVR